MEPAFTPALACAFCALSDDVFAVLSVTPLPTGKPATRRRV